MAFCEVIQASGSTRPDLHKSNHPLQTWYAAAGERSQ